MRCYLNYLLPAVTLVLLLAGALGQQAPTPKRAGGTSQPTGGQKVPAPTADKAGVKSPAAPEVKADQAATKFFRDSIQRLDPERIGWMETTFWQQADVQGLTFQAEGKYLAAPDHRLRLDLHVHVGEASGRLEQVSDGTNLWEAIQVGSSPRLVTHKVDIKQVFAALKSEKEGAEVRSAFLRSQCFDGLVPLLKGIQDRMIITRQEKTRHAGKEMTRLTAVWSPDVENMVTRGGQPWPPYLVRRCYVYFAPLGDKKVQWPYRVEWWGPAPPGTGDALIWQMEFRDPKVGQAMAADRLAREFHFDPGSAEVPDQTKQVAEQVRQQAVQLAARKKAK